MHQQLRWGTRLAPTGKQLNTLETVVWNLFNSGWTSHLWWLPNPPLPLITSRGSLAVKKYLKCGPIWLPNASQLDQTNANNMFNNYQKSFQKQPLITLWTPPSHPEDSQRWLTDAKQITNKCSKSAWILLTNQSIKGWIIRLLMQLFGYLMIENATHKLIRPLISRR